MVKKQFFKKRKKEFLTFLKKWKFERVRRPFHVWMNLMYSSVRSFARSSVRSFSRSLVRSFILSFLVRSFILCWFSHSFVLSLVMNGTNNRANFYTAETWKSNEHTWKWTNVSRRTRSFVQGLSSLIEGAWDDGREDEKMNKKEKTMRWCAGWDSPSPRWLWIICGLTTSRAAVGVSFVLCSISDKRILWTRFYGLSSYFLQVERRELYWLKEGNSEVFQTKTDDLLYCCLIVHRVLQWWISTGSRHYR